jgi:hypothetical protein
MKRGAIMGGDGRQVGKKSLPELWGHGHSDSSYVFLYEPFAK